MTCTTIIRNYMTLIVLNTLSTSIIWGVNTLFLLDAGLNNYEAFVVNAFFTLGMVLFEIPTGVVADTVGRRASYLLGCITLFVSSILYFYLWQIKAHMFFWIVTSLLVGLGFTFFSGALEAWLVDALKFVNYDGPLEDVFSKGQITHGLAMLLGTVIGGFAAELGDLGTPYLIRIGALFFSIVVAGLVMRDLGFEKRPLKNVSGEMKRIFKASVDNGIKVPHIRWMMLTSPFMMGASFYVFYAAQPFLLELYGDNEAYGVAGIAAALFAASQIAGGMILPHVRHFFVKRTQMIFILFAITIAALIFTSFSTSFWMAICGLIVWSFAYSVATPVKQAYMNESIASEQRATILSFDSLMSSTGGFIFQPALGKSADIWSYPVSYMISSALQLGALPFVYLAGRENHPADRLDSEQK